ncbi:hypothetical protein ACHHYP_03935, partial [Achlya hypogyna]
MFARALRNNAHVVAGVGAFTLGVAGSLYRPATSSAVAQPLTLEEISARLRAIEYDLGIKVPTKASSQPKYNNYP